MFSVKRKIRKEIDKKENFLIKLTLLSNEQSARLCISVIKCTKIIIKRRRKKSLDRI